MLKLFIAGFISLFLTGCIIPTNPIIEYRYVFVKPPILTYNQVVKPNPLNFKAYLDTDDDRDREMMCFNTLTEYETAYDNLYVSRTELSKWVDEQSAIYDAKKLRSEHAQEKGP